jgi:uncharacterized protein (TIGR02099 family)
MLKVARYLHGKFWLVMAWLVILFAILITAARIGLPHIDLAPYKDQIEEVVERGAKAQFTIGKVQAELRGFRLVLKFTDVSLSSEYESQPLSHAREVRIGVELFNTLLTGRLTLGSAVVVGTRVEVEQHADGSISLQGFKADAGEGDAGKLSEVLLGQSRLQLFDSEIFLKSANPDRPTLRLSNVAVELLNDEGRHQLSIKAKVGWQERESIRVIADLREGVDNPLALTGRFFLKGENLKTGNRLSEWLPEGYKVDRGVVQLELWGYMKEGHLARLHGTSELTDFQITGPAIETPFQLDRLASELLWKKHASGWQLDLDSLVLVRDGLLWPPGRLSLAWQSEDESGWMLRLGADYLSLKELNDFVSIIELPNPELGDALTGLAPDGHLTRFGFALQQPPEGEPSWHVKGVVARYRNRPWQSVPGMEGLRLSFEGNQAGGWLRLDSSDFAVEFPKLFRDPLKAKRLTGDFSWRFKTETGLHLSSDRIVMHNQDVQTLSRLDMQIPLSGTDLFVDMQTDFWNGDGSKKSDYLPTGIMPVALVDWLDKSVVSGHVNSGSFLLYGPLNKFPFNRQEGRFEVWFGVEDLVLDYMPGWPRIEEGLGEASFINNSFEAFLTDGLLFGNRVRKGRANILQLREASPVVISGEVEGPISDVVKLLGETPLQKHFGPLVEAVEVSGKSETRMSMAIPLKRSDELKIDGRLKMINASMKVKPARLDVRQINGELHFSEDQVDAKGIKAQVMGQPVSVNVSPWVSGQGRWTRIATRLDISRKQIEERYPEWWLPPGKGKAASDVTLEIAHDQSDVPVRLFAKSDLKGMAVDLPSPMNKSAEQAKRMDLQVNFMRDQSTDLSLFYGKEIHALVRLPAESDRSPKIGIGLFEEPELPAAYGGYKVAGRLERLEADPWLQWIASNAAEEGAPASIDIDIKADQMSVADIECPNAHFSARNFADGYRIKLRSDTVQGLVQVPGDWQHLPLLGRFEKIHLNLDKVAAAISGDEAATKAPVEVDPKMLPAMDISVDELYLNDLNLGRSHFRWKKERDGITITEMTLLGDQFDLSGQGYWRLTEKGHVTSLNLRSKITSLGDLQRQLGLETGVKGAPAEVKAELYWPTSPLDMGAEGLYGSIWLKVGKGQVTDVDPGMGRLIGLFSLNALGKRLALDFRDFFAEGFTFEDIEGHFTIHDGKAETQDLLVNSTSANIEFSGVTGLVDRTYDQQVIVTPHLSATLPIVGALAVNPTVGVALAVTQKLLGKQFDKIVQRTYEVTGSWDDPQFKQLSKQPVSEEDVDMGIELPGRG